MFTVSTRHFECQTEVAQPPGQTPPCGGILSTMKDLPIGIQTFEGIVRGEYAYVDKTRFLYGLIKTGMQEGAGSPKFFLSRPRRFGKSLTISTLDALFSGRRALFKGLWIG
jgi:hypothetical protein